MDPRQSIPVNGDVSQWRAMDMTSTARMLASITCHGDLSQWELRTYCDNDSMP